MPTLTDLEAKKDQLHELLLSLREVDGETGCEIYIGPWAHDGTGRIKVGSQGYTAARVAAWLYVGGFDLDDKRVVVCRNSALCRFPACINPRHLCIRRYRAKRRYRTAVA